MKNHGLFSTFFIDEIKSEVSLDDSAGGRMAALAQTWRNFEGESREDLWETFLKQAISYLQFVPPSGPTLSSVYHLYEDWSYSQVITVLYLTEPNADLNDTAIGRFWPAKLLAALRQRGLTWGILTNGAVWRLYSWKTSRPYEDYVELNLAEALEGADEDEYGLFERFFHKDSFEREETDQAGDEALEDKVGGVFKCRLDRDKEASENLLDEYVKKPLLYQVDEILRYLCNGFIADTPRQGEEYTEEERQEIFQSAVRLVYRCLFLFYAEARSLLPTEPDKVEVYARHSISYLCQEARRFQWGQRQDVEGYDLWQHLQGLIHAVHDGDPEYGIIGYNGGLFDDEEVKFLGTHRMRNDFLSRTLYLLAYVEPYDSDPDDEYAIPYEDLEVRHLGELYENILEYTVVLSDADLIRRRTKKGVETLLVSETTWKKGDSRIKKGDVYFGATALERKQTGSFYTPEPLVRFLNQKAIIEPLRQKFAQDCQPRFAEFLEQASAGIDQATRRGAAQAAVALTERFVHDAVLDFKVCDPAMGSGHFLVNAANQMSGLVVELLAEIPEMEGIKPKVTSDINAWRRQITRHCLYGVDLNPLAVDLAKLSLWLNCFARRHKLTFLDHHLRCGNSLVGLRNLDQLKTIPLRKKDKKKKDSHPSLHNFEALSLNLAEMVQESHALAAVDEDETERQKAMLAEVEDTKSQRLAPVADLFTAYLMDGEIEPEEYHGIYRSLVSNQLDLLRQRPNLDQIVREVQIYKKSHNFFHWPLEFPEVFGTAGKGGFKAAIGNPPWEIIKPNSQEFFAFYDPDFRRYNKQKANSVAARLMKDNEAIRKRWEDYTQFFAEESLYVREPEAYEALGSGDINTYKLFLERFFTLLGPQGRLGIVVPSGLYTDQGCLPLRKLFFNRTRIDFLYCFENRKGIFNIHRSFKFILFGTEKGVKTEAFKCAFMKHDSERLPDIDSNALKMRLEHVKKFSPDTLSVMEFKQQNDIDITSKLYEKIPLLGNKVDGTWNVKFSTELHMSGDSHLFIEKQSLENSKSYSPLFEGKHIWILTDGMGEFNYWVIKSNLVDIESTKKTKVIYRALAANTNERTLISTVIPPGYVTGHSLNVCTLKPDNCLILASILTSFVIDWVIRNKVTINLTMFYLYQLPIPRISRNQKNGKPFTKNELIIEAIIARAARLISTTEIYSSLWKNVYISHWQNPDFWYPQSGPSINDYGPKHEQYLRERILDSASSLTREWSDSCGVHDRTPERRDTGNRAQLRGEIDAYVAHLYGLGHDDFAYILDTFPVLRQKEEKAFGEFMSKRKCLEEYDRIAKVL